MEHHNDVGASLERLDVAGLLVAAVTLVFLMKENAEAELARHFDRGIGRNVIDHDAFVDAVARDVAKRLLERPAGIVSRHDHNGFQGWHRGANLFPAGDHCQSESCRPSAGLVQGGSYSLVASQTGMGGVKEFA